MQAILKGKHQRFCDWLTDVRVRQAVPSDKLGELENEMLSLYAVYQQKMQELRSVINEYEERQKAIKNEVKRSRRYSGVGYEIK